MKFSPLLVSLFSLTVLAAPAPSSRLVARDDAAPLITASLQVDMDIVQHLETLFRESVGESPIEKRGESNEGNTVTDLTTGKCARNILIWARGTFEGGNVGSMGRPLIDAINKVLPGSTIGEGVLPYPATIAGYLAGGSSEGANSLVNLIKRAATQCPSASITIGGYSQGAQVVHLAASRLASSFHSKVKAIVLVGDPKKGQALPSGLQGKQITLCNEGDLICSGLPIPGGQHSSENYIPQFGTVANFVKARV